MTVIERAQSERSPPIIFGAKKNGSLHFCIDYRKLNVLIVKDANLIPTNGLVSPLVRLVAHIFDARQPILDAGKSR